MMIALSTNTLISNFTAACKSVGTAATMASAGIYLHRRGFITSEGKKLLAQIAQNVTIPALLFTKIVYCKQDVNGEACTSVTDMLGDVWVLLFWPLYVVGWGLILGHFAAKWSGATGNKRKLVMVTCAFGNSTGLPITLLSVIHTDFPKSTELGRIDPTLFLSIYLLLYPMLQWGIGGYLLAPKAIVEDDDNDDDDDESCMLEICNEINTSIQSQTKHNIKTLEDDKPIVENTPLTISTLNGKSYSTPNQITENSTFSASNTITTRFPKKIKSNQCTNETMNIVSYALQPPVVFSLLGLFVTIQTPLRSIFVVMVSRNNQAPLEWLFDGVYAIGQSAVPINMMILGCNLSLALSSKPEPTEFLSFPITVAVVLSKMVIMPIIGIISAVLLKRYIWDIPDAIDSAFYLVLMIVFICPTANNVMVMVELGERNDVSSKEGIARLIAWQYAIAPILLSINVAIIVSIVSYW